MDYLEEKLKKFRRLLSKRWTSKTPQQVHDGFREIKRCLKII